MWLTEARVVVVIVFNLGWQTVTMTRSKAKKHAKKGWQVTTCGCSAFCGLKFRGAAAGVPKGICIRCARLVTARNKNPF